jgi:hypothetical protein
MMQPGEFFISMRHRLGPRDEGAGLEGTSNEDRAVRIQKAKTESFDPAALCQRG